jgi:hypothetical protein
MKALALLLVLAGCGDQASWERMDCTGARISRSFIAWQVEADPKVACEALGAETLDRGGACIQCTGGEDGQNFCVLHAPAPGVVGDMVLGHELKHAFGCKHASPGMS